MTSRSSKENAQQWWSDDRLKPVRVVVCMSNCTAVGYTYRVRHQRLLDTLNHGLVANLSRIGHDFVPLTDVQMFFPAGEQQYLTSAHISKANILFVVEIGNGQPETASTRKVIKKHLAVKMRLQSYGLIGNMHATIWGQLVHTVESDERFLPLTNVDITPKLFEDQSRFAFVAINRHQVLYAAESIGLISGPESALTEVKTIKEINREPLLPPCPASAKLRLKKPRGRQASLVANRIIPEFQHLQVGDVIPMGKTPSCGP